MARSVRYAVPIAGVEDIDSAAGVSFVGRTGQARSGAASCQPLNVPAISIEKVKMVSNKTPKTF